MFSTLFKLTMNEEDRKQWLRKIRVWLTIVLIYAYVHNLSHEPGSPRNVNLPSRWGSDGSVSSKPLTASQARRIRGAVRIARHRKTSATRYGIYLVYLTLRY